MFGVGRFAAAVSVASALALGLLVAPATARPPASVDRSWPINADGKGCAPPVWPVGDTVSDDSRVLVIGDSLIRDARADLESSLIQAGFTPTVRCWGAKGTSWGAEQVKRARALRQLPRHVVVSLGTNDIWWLGTPMDVAIDRMMAAIGSKRSVYWVNLWFGPHGYSRLPKPNKANRILRAKAKQYPNLRVINFAGAFRAAKASGEPVGWADGVHLNPAGYRLRNHTIVTALSTP